MTANVYGAPQFAILIPTAVQTSAYTANPGDFVPVSTAGGSVTVTLPAAPPDGTLVAVKMVIQGGANMVTIAASGSDVLERTGGGTTVTLASPGQSVTAQYSAGLAVWYLVTEVLPSGFLTAPVIYAPAAQTALAVTSTSFAAFSSANVNTGSFVAPASGSVVVTLQAIIECSAAAGFALALAAHGTVSPLVCNAVIYKDSSGTATPRDYTVAFLVTGLTPGTAYNLDLVGAVTSTDTLTILALGTTSTSPALTVPGAPVLIRVEAA